MAAGGVARGWDSEFESALLQQRVHCEPDFLGRDQFEVEINDTQELSGGGRSRFRDYGGADRKHDGEIELRPGDEVRLKANSPHAHLTDTHRLGRVEKVQGERLLVRLKHASFRVFRS